MSLVLGELDRTHVKDGVVGYLVVGFARGWVIGLNIDFAQEHVGTFLTYQAGELVDVFISGFLETYSNGMLGVAFALLGIQFTVSTLREDLVGERRGSGAQLLTVVAYVSLLLLVLRQGGIDLRFEAKHLAKSVLLKTGIRPFPKGVQDNSKDDDETRH